jgi:hypothetical protein
MYNEKYAPLTAYFNGRFIDRTGTLDVGFNQYVNTPIPTTIRSSDDFEVIVEREARRIDEHAKKVGKKILILWSGGIDSTCVVSAFIKQNIDIVVSYNNFSIEENPRFYREILEKNSRVTLRLVPKPLFEIYDYDDQFVFVTGECGAQLMGTISWEKFAGGSREDMIVNPEYSVDLLASKTPLYGMPNPWRHLLLPIVDKCPVELKTNYDYLWWCTFALKWQLMEFRMQLLVGKMVPDLFNFFLTEDFAMWALNNDHQVKCPHLMWINYKMPMRNYIYSLSYDRKVYTMKKIKSLPKSHPEVTRWGKQFNDRCIINVNGETYMDIRPEDRERLEEESRGRSRRLNGYNSN